LKRLDSLQVYRGIAAILIILYHVADYSRKSLDYAFRGDSFAFTYGFVDFFLVLTGFMVLYAYGGDIGHRDRFLPYLRGRFMRIYPFFWVISFVKIAALLLIPGYGKSYEKDPLYIVESLLLIPQKNLPIIGAAWILSYIVLFYLVFALIILLGRRWGIVILAGWAAFIIASAVGNSLDLYALPSNDLLDFLLYPRNLEFILGCVSALVIKSQRLRQPLPVFFAGLLLFALGRLYIYFVSAASAMELTLVVGLPSSVLVTASAMLDQRNWVRFPRFLVFLGNASYSIYLAGFAVVNLCALLLFRPPFSGLVSPFLLALVIAVLAILGACLVHLLVERPLIDLMKRRAVFPKKQVAVSPSLARGAR
jgi:exopolysaccharide production protein ExoZ